MIRETHYAEKTFSHHHAKIVTGTSRRTPIQLSADVILIINTKYFNPEINNRVQSMKFDAEKATDPTSTWSAIRTS